MANYNMNNVSLFHSFSKVAAADNTALSAAVNKAGHVVTASDVWANEIPFCGSADSLADIKTKFVDNTAFPVGTLGYDLSTSKLYQKGEADWTEITPATAGNYVTISYKNKPVLRWYNKAPLTLLTPENNGAPSNGFSAKYLGPAGDGVGAISQFVSSTDKIVNGIVSDGYDIAVYNGSTKLTKGTSTAAADNQWMDSAYAGMILFMCAQTSKNLAMTCFEYVGEKVSNVIDVVTEHAATISTHTSEISEIKEKLGLEDTTPDSTPTLGGRVADNEAALRTLLGLGENAKVEATESIATTAATAATNAINALEVASTGDHGITASQTKGEIALSVTVATVGEDGAIAEASADNVVTATGAQNIAKAAATAAITDAIGEGSAITEEVQSQISAATLEGKISENDESTDLVTAAQVVTYVSETAKVTLTASTTEGNEGIVIDPNGSESTSFTIGIDQTKIATKKYVDDEIEGAIDALSAADGVITTLTKTVNTAQENAAASEAAAKAAQAAAEAAKGEATAAKTEAAGSKTAAEAASTQAAQSATSSSESAAAAAASKEAAEASASAADTSAKAAAASEAAATASQAAAEKAADDAEAAAADAAAAKTTVEGFESTLNAASLNKSGTLEGKFTITTEGTVKGGLTKIEITDAGLGKLITDAQTQADKGVADAATAQKAAEDASAAVNTLKTTGITASSVSGAGISVTLGGEVGTPALSGSVTTAGYAKATETMAGVWTNVNNVITGTAVKDALADVASAHTKDIQAIQQTLNGLTTTGLTREIAASKEAVTNPAANVIYLIPEDGAESGTYVEYLYVDGTWEAIGTTSTDLSEYAKTEAVTELVEAVQGEVDALEALVGTTSVESQITTKLSALTDETAQGSAGVTLTQTNGKVTLTVTPGSVADGNTSVVTGGAVYTAIKAVSDLVGTTSVASQITAAIEALDVAKHGNNGIELTQTDGKVALAVTADTTVTEGSTNVVTSGAVATAVKAVSDLVGTTAVATQITNAIAALDSEKTGNGITVTLTDGKVTGVSAATGTVAANNGDVVTGGVVHTAVEAVKTIAEAKISAVQNDSTHFGSPLVATAGTTVTVSPAKEWSVGSTKPATTITSVINGKMSDGKTIDDANLVDGTSMFAGNTALTTYVGDLGKLTAGTNMFSGCTKLVNFCGDLGSLVDGTDMFKGCPLSEESIIYIVDSLPMVTSGTICLGTTVPEDLKAEAEEIKGWTVVVA